jgi:hypothetical protein
MGRTSFFIELSSPASSNAWPGWLLVALGRQGFTREGISSGPADPTG